MLKSVSFREDRHRGGKARDWMHIFTTEGLCLPIDNFNHEI